jgi:hypothetical protein
MNKSNKRIIALVLAASSLAVLTGCGAAPNNGAVAPGAAGIAGIGGGCVPINTTTMIGFTATNMYMGNPQTNDMRVLAGIIPPGDALASGGTNYGTMIVQPGNIAAPVISTGSLGSYQGQRVDGTTIQMNVSSAIAPVAQTGYPYNNGYSAWPANGMVNAQGYIQVSSFIQSLLMTTAVGGSTGFGTSIGNTAPGTYPTGYPAGYGTTTQICVSNLAISLQRTNSSYANWLYQGTVYFYLSGGVTNGQHGLALNF